MRFVCRSHLTNTKISIDKRRLSHIFVFAAHSPHRNKNVMFEPKKSSIRDTIFFFFSQMQKIQVTSNSTTVQPLHSLYEQLNFVRYFAANLLDSRKSEETLCDSWVLSTSVCVARSPVDFCSATTEAERRPLVFSVPIPLRTQRAKAPTRRKEFLLICVAQKLEQFFIDE